MSTGENQPIDSGTLVETYGTGEAQNATAAFDAPGPARRSSLGEEIIVRGARVHNLKNIDCTISHNQLTVVTGLSGSGKSSLAFDSTLRASGATWNALGARDCRWARRRTGFISACADHPALGQAMHIYASWR